MDDVTEVMRRYCAAWDAHDGALIESVYHPDAVRRSPLGTVQGSDAIRAHAERLWHSRLTRSVRPRTGLHRATWCTLSCWTKRVFRLAR